MDQALRNALKRKKELENELVEIDKFIQLHQRFSGTNREKTEPSPVNSGQNTPRGHTVYHLEAKPLVIRHRRGQPDSFANMMARVISDMRRPLKRSELVAALEDRGVEIPSSDKERYLGTILWRHKDRFKNFAHVGYWLAGRPWEPENYMPVDTPLDPIDMAEHRDQAYELFGPGAVDLK